MAKTDTIPKADLSIPVAIDDGHSEIKVAYLEHGTHGFIITKSFPSRVAPGIHEAQITGEATDCYEVSDGGVSERFSILVRGQDGWSGTAAGRSPDYPTSTRNRVLVHHALFDLAQKWPNATFTIATTLPYSDFHLSGGGKNNPLIDAKKANISRPVFRLEASDGNLIAVAPNYAIGENHVAPEGLAVFFDEMWAYDEAVPVADKRSISQNPAFSDMFKDTDTFVVIDVGGKTTDVVFGNWRLSSGRAVPAIDLPKSSSLPLGGMNVVDELASEVNKQYGFQLIDPEMTLIRRMFYRLGKPVAVGPLVDRAADNLAMQIFERISGYLERAQQGVAAVILAGGGAMLVAPALRKMMENYPVLLSGGHSSDMPADSALNPAQFANARGLLKLVLSLRSAAAE